MHRDEQNVFIAREPQQLDSDGPLFGQAERQGGGLCCCVSCVLLSCFSVDEVPQIGYAHLQGCRGIDVLRWVSVDGGETGAQRFVAIGNLLGYQGKRLFPETPGPAYEQTKLLAPLWDVRKQLTVYRGLDHGLKGGHFAVHSFLTGVLNSEAQNRPLANVSIDQFMADAIGHQTRFASLTVGSEEIGRAHV